MCTPTCSASPLLLYASMLLPLIDCKGRCGAEYYRGYMCQCDYTCLSYGECCKDYESQCTTKNSCKGRCGESFKRGQLCSCDSDCIKYKQCCQDYTSHCDAEGSLHILLLFYVLFFPDDSNDTNLCSGRPVSAVTTLRNGTIVVFRGHYFWVLDRNRMPGPAQGITQVWGVPSPIDTVFTRCNCQGKTYIFRGTQYWRFENAVLDPGYPKVIEMGFDGLRGHITAALSVPQYQTRRESVYFFKRGGLVQKYSYQFGTGPTCGRKPQHTIYTVRHRMVRQSGFLSIGIHSLRAALFPVSLLGPTINIRTSWRGFPSTVTAAVSVPNREPEGYKYYVFSRCKSIHTRTGVRSLI
uniref:Proteoglycan 4b n=1 Tax=Seriola dumerili TaxID=41447 RepID=A0A3B4UAC5_SERDU